jgi:hypothetical protein
MFRAAGLSDQPAFRQAVYESGLRLATLPSEYNCRLPFPGAIHNPVRILHGRLRNYGALEKRLNAKSGPRCFWLRFGSVQTRGCALPGTSIVSQFRWGLQTGGLLHVVRRVRYTLMKALGRES